MEQTHRELVPFSPTLEEAYLPNVDKLVAKVRELASY